MLPASRSEEPSLGGVDAFIEGVSRIAAENEPNRLGTVRFLLRISDDYAYIRLRDVLHPLRFLRQMSGHPPVRLGTDGFRSTIVDDRNPARHYTAFVFVGFWLPTVVATLFLWLWEVASFFRYKGHWSPKDITSGRIGIRHGRLVKRYGPSILPGLIAAELAEPSTSST